MPIGEATENMIFPTKLENLGPGYIDQGHHLFPVHTGGAMRKPRVGAKMVSCFEIGTLLVLVFK